MMNRLFDSGKLKCFACLDPSKDSSRSLNRPRSRSALRKFRSSKGGGDKTAPTNCTIIGSKKKNGGSSSGNSSPPSNSSTPGSSGCFTFQELANATDNFSSAHLLLEESSGCVYKGTLKNGQVVAVKRLDGNVRQCNMRLLVEVLILNCMTHPNIVKMIGYCSDGDRRLLVFEYVPMGTLQEHLHDLRVRQKPMDWSTRMKIAAGAAKALEYLHDKAKPQVIFRDFKPSNVLLDDEFSPKLYNFGLAKICSVKNEASKVVGTNGYCAPESADPDRLTVNSDLYSFGVVLLELISGRKAIDSTKPQGEQNLVEWARPFLNDPKCVDKIADPKLEGKFPKRGMFQALTVASVCIREDPEGRPPISNVSAALAYLVTKSNSSEDMTNSSNSGEVTRNTNTK